MSGGGFTQAFCGVAVALLLGTLGACSSSSTYRPMTVSVRDKLTGEPVAGAVVHARTSHFFVPMGYIANSDVPMKGSEPILDGSPPRSDGAVTGADGTVRLEVIVDHPVQVIVLAAGYDLQAVDVDEHPSRSGQPSEWLDADPGPALPSEPPRLEIQLSP